MLDPVTVVIANLASYLVLIPLLGLFWLRFRREEAGVGDWLCGISAHALMWISVLAKPLTPAFVSVVIGIALMPVGFAFMCRGLYRFFGIHGAMRSQLLAVAAIILWQVMFLLVRNDLSLRVAGFSSIAVLQLLAVIRTLRQRLGPHEWKLVRPTALSFAGLIVLLSLRVILALSHAGKTGIHSVSPLDTLVLLAMQVGAVLLVISWTILLFARQKVHLEASQQRLLEVEREHRSLLEQQVEERTRQLLQASKLSSLGVMAAGLAHEINNPANYVALNAAALKSWWSEVGKARSVCGNQPRCALRQPSTSAMSAQVEVALEDIAEGAERIGRIVRSLREFSFPAPVEDTPKGPVDLNHAVESALLLAQKHLAKDACRLEAKCTGSPLWILGDLQHLIQVILNLVLNAAQASGGAEMPVAIRTCEVAAARSRTARLVVEDHGGGIAPEHLDKIFDPFFTTRRAEGGTGLGLVIVKRLVEEMEGTLSVDSRPGHGTRVSIDFPTGPATSSV